jgi:hypothetical protein
MKFNDSTCEKVENQSGRKHRKWQSRLLHTERNPQAYLENTDLSELQNSIVLPPQKASERRIACTGLEAMEGIHEQHA